MNPFTLEPVAWVRSPRREVRDDGWGAVRSSIELAQDLSEECFDGLELFSHLEVFFVFHRVDCGREAACSSHPRGDASLPRTGIFAQRKKRRPNRIGASFARLLGRAGRTLLVEGLDAIDGTPVLDIKPAMREFLPRGELTQPEWVARVMADYWQA